ncbi:unnamed protein product [Lactuca virosa]|uniref:UBA domain-containing protein n=1 Tax=Lactuca virosa TaxID=75947 RepID=A0AAU9N609_9ASTR|nr:unnamed protein product [Lactuca virosa]
MWWSKEVAVGCFGLAPVNRKKENKRRRWLVVGTEESGGGNDGGCWNEGSNLHPLSLFFRQSRYDGGWRWFLMEQGGHRSLSKRKKKHGGLKQSKSNSNNKWSERWRGRIQKVCRVNISSLIVRVLSRKKDMDFPEVNKKLLGELEEMGFPLARAMRALHYSGNSSLLDAISWIVDHEDDPEIDQMPSVPLRIEIESSDSSSVSEEVKLKAQKLRDKARRRNKEENMKLEPSREKERIRAGKELQEAKRIAEENERKRSIALRKAEKEEENRARERIRQKLHQDKVERRGGIQSHASLKTTIPVVQENKISPVVTSTRIGVNSTTKVDLMRDCLRSLRRNNKENDMRVKRAFETLLIYVRNVARNPDEDKFRKIRLSNPAFKERVGIFEEGVKFLEVCGFERIEGGEYLLLPRGEVDMAVLKFAGNELQSAITNPYFGLLSTQK